VLTVGGGEFRSRAGLALLGLGLASGAGLWLGLR